MANSDLSALQTDAIIRLFEIDLSAIAIDPNPSITLYLTNQLDTDGVTALVYGGNTYTAAPIDVEGFEVNSDGSMPRPMLTVENAATAFNTLLSAYNGFVGARFTRYRVYYDYLDGKAKGGIGAYITKNADWILNKKTNHNKKFIRWELKNPLDLETVRVPRGQFTRKCQHTYRRWNTTTSSFIYGSCPYADENNNFDEFGNKTSKKNDVCGKRLSDCTIRFQATNPQADIPGLFFPLIPRY